MGYAIVTGGSRGIGREVTRALAEAGLHVIFTYRSGAEEAAALAEALTAAELKAEARSLDVTDCGACTALVNALYRELGAAEVLVNNAGVTADSLLFSMGREQWDKVIDTDLSGVYNMTQPAVFHMMRAKKGRIINIASISGVGGIRGQCNYSAAKAAVLGFTKALAKEVSAFGIAVNAVAPGGVETEMTERLSPEELQKMVAGIPAGRLCRAEEVARTVRWLALESPEYISGSTIVMDGGMGSL